MINYVVTPRTQIKTDRLPTITASEHVKIDPLTLVKIIGCGKLTTEYFPQKKVKNKK